MYTTEFSVIVSSNKVIIYLFLFYFYLFIYLFFYFFCLFIYLFIYLNNLVEFKQVRQCIHVPIKAGFH